MQIDIYEQDNGIGELAAFCHAMIEGSYYPAYCRKAVDMLHAYHEDANIARDLASGRVWVAREGGELVGTVTVAHGELSRMFVKPTARGQGLGLALAREGIAYARETGVKRLTAWSVPFSRGFYGKLGFVTLNAETMDFNNRREVCVPYLEMALWPSGAPEVEISVAGEADAEELLAGQRKAFEEQCLLYDDWSIPPMHETPEDFARFLRSGGTALKACCGGRIIGGVRGNVEYGVCEVGRLFVLPEQQGRHVACRLLAALEERVDGCGGFSLFTGERSEKNLALYARQGYAPTGRCEPAMSHGSLGNYDLVWLEKPNPWPEIRACARRFHTV